MLFKKIKENEDKMWVQTKDADEVFYTITYEKQISTREKLLGRVGGVGGGGVGLILSLFVRKVRYPSDYTKIAAAYPTALSPAAHLVLSPYNQLARVN